MEANKILQADILDILFEDRNKEYGAYQLRKTYNGRLFKAIAVMGTIILLLFVGGMVMGRGTKKVALAPEIRDIDLTAVKNPEAPPPTPPPPLRVQPPQVRMIQFTPPHVVPDPQVKPEDQPPPVDDMENARIGKVNMDGDADAGMVPTAPSDGKTGLVDAPKKKEPDDGGFVPVEVESTFPGGGAAWLRFLNKNLHYPEEAINIEQQGVVVVQFIVDDKGNVSNVTAVSGPEQGGLREEAVRVIKRSGMWTPALQNGRYVKSYKRQPITFKMGD
jgi:protein TonB